jgi:dTDP-glucose 4,6-dehydratase
MKTRILVTGGLGFIGSHVVEHILLNTTWDIVVLDKLTYASNGLNRLRDIGKELCEDRVTVLMHDFALAFPEGITQEIGQVDYIFHIGAESHVDRSMEDAMPFAISNVVGTTNLLEWTKKTQKNLKRYVQFSTDEVYGAAPEGHFFKEWANMHPSNPYSASKAGADMMAYCFQHAYNMPIIFTRTMNCIGERQDKEKFVPKTIRAIMNKEKVILHGTDKDNLSSRCWLHSRNAADALLFLMNKSKIGDMYHIVGVEKSVLDVANIINQEINGRDLNENEIEYIDFHSARPGHDRRYAMSGEKMSKMGWNPSVEFEKSLRKTVQWTIRNSEWIK